MVLNVIVAIAFLILMINVAIPWAVNSMADGFVRQIEATQET